MKKNTQGFGILFSVGMTVIFTLTAFYLLEYIIPFIRTVSGVENSTVAFYNSYSSIEETMYLLKKGSIGYQPLKSMPTVNSGYAYTVNTLSNVLPKPGFGNSLYDKNWSIISSGSPIQIYLPNLTSLSDINIYFRVPNFDGNTATYEIFDDSSFAEKDIINWQVTSPSDILNSLSGNRIQKTNICSSKEVCSSSKAFNFVTPSNKNGFQLDDVQKTFSSFFSAQCSSNYTCMLKISIVNDLVACQSNTSTCLGASPRKRIPYLEYKVDFGSTAAAYNTPSNIINISGIGKSSGYQKNLDVHLPQKGTIEAFDFTIFQ